MTRTVVLAAVLIAFTGWSTWISLDQGYWGFLDIAFEGRWGSQVFLDLCIAITIAWGGLRRDAQRLGINVWPYLIATPFVGSISPLAYLLHREHVNGHTGPTSTRQAPHRSHLNATDRVREPARRGLQGPATA